MELLRRGLPGKRIPLATLAHRAEAEPENARELARRAPSRPSEDTVIKLAAAAAAGNNKVAAEHALADYETAVQRRLDRTRILVRAGPAVGLMGTLIPLAPGLAALGRGRPAPAGVGPAYRVRGDGHRPAGRHRGVRADADPDADLQRGPDRARARGGRDGHASATTHRGEQKDEAKRQKREQERKEPRQKAEERKKQEEKKQEKEKKDEAPPTEAKPEGAT